MFTIKMQFGCLWKLVSTEESSWWKLPRWLLKWDLYAFFIYFFLFCFHLFSLLGVTKTFQQNFCTVFFSLKQTKKPTTFSGIYIFKSENVVIFWNLTFFFLNIFRKAVMLNYFYQTIDLIFFHLTTVLKPQIS